MSQNKVLDRDTQCSFCYHTFWKENFAPCSPHFIPLTYPQANFTLPITQFQPFSETCNFVWLNNRCSFKYQTNKRRAKQKVSKYLRNLVRGCAKKGKTASRKYQRKGEIRHSIPWFSAYVTHHGKPPYINTSRSPSLFNRYYPFPSEKRKLTTSKRLLSKPCRVNKNVCALDSYTME